MNRIQADAALRRILAGTASATGFEFFGALVRNLAEVLQTRAAWVTRFVPDRRLLQSLAFWLDGGLLDGFDYDIEGTPCAEAIERRCLVHIPERARELFPGDTELTRLAMESFLAVPILDPDGAVLGHVAVMDDRPMPAEPDLLAVFELFAARAAAELRRLTAEDRFRVLRDETEFLRQAVRDAGDGEFLGDCPAMQALFDSIARVAATDATVLILGETGTGKELVARSIHRASRRRERPLVRVNCAAIPGALVESEFFGHEKGAFTGATARRDGRFTLADGGTIFLDEVGELPLELQAKLLRVLQEGEFEPLGSARTRKVDVRVVAATNRDLRAAVAEGGFREDLYYRLDVFPLRIPPLRERGRDIAELAQRFARRFALRCGRPVREFCGQDLEALLRYAWPGNVRELQNVVERAVILATGDRLDVQRALPTGASAVPTTAAAAPRPRVLTDAELRELERENLRAALDAAGGRISGAGGAAEMLGLNPNTLSSRLKSLGIARPG